MKLPYDLNVYDAYRAICVRLGGSRKYCDAKVGKSLRDEEGKATYHHCPDIIAKCFTAIRDAYAGKGRLVICVYPFANVSICARNSTYIQSKNIRN